MDAGLRQHTHIQKSGGAKGKLKILNPDGVSLGPQDRFQTSEPPAEQLFYRPGQVGLPRNLGNPARTPGVGLNKVTVFDIAEAKKKKKLQQDLNKFKDRLPPAAKESFQKLSPDKQEDVMRLGPAFKGASLGDSSLVKLMMDGRLFEKDSSGHTPLQRLNDLTSSHNTQKADGNFLARVLDGIENPQQSKDAARKDLPSAVHDPSEFTRAAVEEVQLGTLGGWGSQWTDSPVHQIKEKQV